MAIVCTSMFYLTFSLHKHGRPVGFIFRCRFAATPKNENDRRRSVLFLGVAARGRPPTLDPLLWTPYFAPPTLHHLLCTPYFASPTLHPLLCTPYFAPPTLHLLLCIPCFARKRQQCCCLLAVKFRVQKSSGAKYSVQSKGGCKARGTEKGWGAR